MWYLSWHCRSTFHSRTRLLKWKCIKAVQNKNRLNCLWSSFRVRICSIQPGLAHVLRFDHHGQNELLLREQRLREGDAHVLPRQHQGPQSKLIYMQSIALCRANQYINLRRSRDVFVLSFVCSLITLASSSSLWPAFTLTVLINAIYNESVRGMEEHAT